MLKFVFVVLLNLLKIVNSAGFLYEKKYFFIFNNFDIFCNLFFKRIRNCSIAKSYKGVGFELAYPNNWGLLTCNNSVNFEFDPEKSQDMLKVNCDRAVKPITVLVSDNLSCQGDNIKLGNNSVVRIVEGTKGAEADYRWCVINPNGVDLDITQRVSNSGRPSSSRQDFAVQIEQVISSVNFSR